MTENERFTVDSDGKYYDKINHKYVNLDYLFRLVEELDSKVDNKQYTINEMAKTLRTYDDAYIDLNKKYKELVDENKQLKKEKEYLKEEIRLLKVDLDNIDLFEERKVKYSEFWAEKLKKLLGD